MILEHGQPARVIHDTRAPNLQRLKRRLHDMEFYVGIPIDTRPC